MTQFTAYQRDPATGVILLDPNGYPLIAQAGLNTYQMMQARVQDEVLGPATNTHIQNAINDAINTFERETFWFTDIRIFTAVPGSASALVTAPHQEYISWDQYPLLIQMPHIRNIYVLAFGNRYPLHNRTPQWMDDQSVNPSWTGLPTDWCWQAGAIRLYPIPNGSYPLILAGTLRYAPLVNPGDTNPWLNEAEPLIRTEAKRLLFTNISRDTEQAQLMMMEIHGTPQLGRQGYLQQLRRETQRRSGGPGHLRPARGWIS